MSGEIYQVEVGFPDWVDSTEDEALVGAAIGNRLWCFKICPQF